MEKKKHKKIIFGCLAIIVSLLFNCTAFALNIPEDLVQEVNKAMADGEVLFDAYSEGPAAQEELLQEIDEAKSRINDFCEFTYNAYVIPTEKGDTIYFIAEPLLEGQIVFGRHYKVTKQEITPSTATCFASPSPPDNSVVAYTTHFLSGAPTEFHVFLSLKHRIPIYVGTLIGTWKVDLGKIELVEKAKRSGR